MKASGTASVFNLKRSVEQLKFAEFVDANITARTK
jgi:hypothetical protein